MTIYNIKHIYMTLKLTILNEFTLKHNLNIYQFYVYWNCQKTWNFHKFF